MDATLSADHRIITVSFVGAARYQPADPCSADYRPWVGVANGILQVVVVETIRPFRFPVGTGSPDIACPAIGYRYVFHLALPVPYDGAEVDDQTGTRFWVAPPHGLATLRILPAGWSLQASFTEAEPGSSLYVRVYAAGPLPTPPLPFPDNRPSEGPGRLFVYQAFGAPVAATIGDPTARAIAVEVGGVGVTLYHQQQSGQLFLSFMVGSNGIALDAYEPDFTPESLAALANGITAGPPQPTASP